MSTARAPFSTPKILPLEEKQWVRRVREEGDHDAFEQIFRAYYKRLHGFAYSYIGRSDHAEDIVQTVFLKIWSQRQEWDPPGTLKQYLFSAVRNESLNHLRHHKVVIDSEEEVQQFYINLRKPFIDENSVETESLKRSIEHGINQLPTRCRQIFILNRRSGLTYEEIAQILDISVNTVTTQMGRALKSLRVHLAGFIHYFALLVCTCLNH